MTATETIPERFYTTAEVLARLKISRDKFYKIRKRFAEEGHPLEVLKLGHHTLRWPEATLDALFEALREPSS